MRRFSSYGPVDTEVHFYAPRAALVDSVLSTVVGENPENPEQGGGYVTVWAPRQSGKSWKPRTRTRWMRCPTRTSRT